MIGLRLKEQDRHLREQDHRYKEQGGPMISAPRGNTHRSDAEKTNMVFKSSFFLETNGLSIIELEEEWKVRIWKSKIATWKSKIEIRKSKVS